MIRTADLILKVASRLPANERHLAELIVESAIELAERRRIGDRAGRRYADHYVRDTLRSILADDGMVAVPLTAWFGVILPVAWELADGGQGAGVRGRRFKPSGRYAATFDFLTVASRYSAVASGSAQSFVRA